MFSAGESPAGVPLPFDEDVGARCFRCFLTLGLFRSLQNFSKQLEIPILVRSDDHDRFLEVNFDKGLLRLFSEIELWQRYAFCSGGSVVPPHDIERRSFSLSFVLVDVFGGGDMGRLKQDIPYSALELYHQADEKRITRENVLLLVHEYNDILAALNDDERKVQ